MREEALISIRDPSASRSQTVRVLQWNILADGLADDGFLVHHATAGDSRPLEDLLREIRAARGDEQRLSSIKSKCESKNMRSNFEAVIDWNRRWLKMQEIIMQNDPHIITLQELDHMVQVQEELLRIGYVCCYRNSELAYKPHSLSRRDSPTYFKHLYESGIAFAPKMPSHAKAYGEKRKLPNADNDGCAVFWKKNFFEATKIDFVGLDGKRNDSCVRVELRRKVDSTYLYVICAHLSSGSSIQDERKRLSEIRGYTLTPTGAKTGPSLLEWFNRSAEEHPTIFCLDANSEPTRTEEDTVWRAMYEAQSVWKEYYDATGRVVGDKFVVTTNKMRGPLSEQVGTEEIVTTARPHVSCSDRR